MDTHRLENAFRVDMCKDYLHTPQELTAEAFLEREGVPMREETALMPPPSYCGQLRLVDPSAYQARTFNECSEDKKASNATKSGDIRRKKRNQTGQLAEKRGRTTKHRADDWMDYQPDERPDNSSHEWLEGNFTMAP
jgi:hypothetical protein